MLLLAHTFRRFVRPHRWRLTVGLIALALSAGMELAQPWPLKLVVDSVLGDHPLPGWMPAWLRAGSADTQLAVLSAALLVFVAVGGVLVYVGTYWTQSVGQRVTYDIREAVHAHLHRLSLAYHHSQRPGDLAARLTSDVDRIQDVVISVAVNLVTSVLVLIGMFVVMVVVSWQFTLLALAASPLLFITVYRYQRRIKFSSRDVRQQEGRVAAVVQESLSAIQLVQAYTREDYEGERFRREAAGSLESGIRATMLQARFTPLVDFFSAVATVMVLWFGAHQVLAGRLTLGLMLVFLSYLNGLYKPMKQLSKLSVVISKGTAAAERLSEIMRAAPSLPEPRHPHAPRRVRGEITFERVSFTYPLGRDAALTDISFGVRPGEVVGLVGPTGAGKSTIASLVPRFYDPRSGSVQVDGRDLRDWDLHRLRSNVSLVLQDTWLFQASVWENIAYGRPNASFDEVVEAARLANALEFIERLPGGFDTVVGPRGATLSGGQRQRISIARATLRGAPILILDEPTTGLDPHNERLVLDALRRLMAKRTTIVIAHHAAPVLAADEVLVIEGGRIVERGTHQQLLHDGGRYRQLRDGRPGRQRQLSVRDGRLR